MTDSSISLEGLPAADVPHDLRPAAYFDVAAHGFSHRALLDNAASVCSAVGAIHHYTCRWLMQAVASRTPAVSFCRDKTPAGTPATGCFDLLLDESARFKPGLIVGAPAGSTRHTVYVGAGASVVGATLYLEEGSIFIGEGSRLEPGAGVKGPAILGQRTEIRQGAYLRGDVITGDDVTLRGEFKNCVLMDNATFPHPCYVGDSLCGYKTHAGNQVTTANLGLFAGLAENGHRPSLVARCEGRAVDLGLTKMGICMGDFCQVGCNTVSDPATFLKPHTIVYPLTRLPKGFYGPNEILKNKPMEHGIIEKVPFTTL